MAERSTLAPRLGAYWRGEEVLLEEEVLADADALDEALPALTRSAGDQLQALLGQPSGEVLLLWCAANAPRREAQVAELLRAAMAREPSREQALAVARARIALGPLLDAIACVPLLGDGEALEREENALARARIEILIWEAGASALALPALGEWIWSSASTFEAMIGKPARGSLRHRVLAARGLEVSVGGMPAMADPELIGRTLQVLQPLLLHPEPLVWVHAARALGRLTGQVEALEGTLLDWARGDSPLLRQRAMTAFASLPARRLGFLASQLVAFLDSPDEEAWALAAVAAATPYLFFERRDLWDRLAARILAGDGGAIAARALARGLATLFRRGGREDAVESPCARSATRPAAHGRARSTTAAAGWR